MLPYNLHCTVCQGMFESRESWLYHLQSADHRNSAIMECGKWRKVDRESVLIVFSSTSMEFAEGLLNHFSEKDAWTIVTDFVWWPARRKVGLIQFESRETVDRVLKTLGGDGSRLDLEGHIFYFKRAENYIEFEWNELIIGSDHGLYDSAKTKQSVVNSDIRTSSAKVMTGPRNTNNDSIPIENLSHPSVSQELRVDQPVFPSSSPAVVASVAVQSFSFGSSSLTTSKLMSQFQKIYKTVEIPDEKFNQALRIIDNVEKTFGPEYFVTMYRNWYLKLRFPGNDLLSLFIYRKGNPKSRFHIFRSSSRKLPKKLLTLCNMGQQTLLSDYKMEEHDSKSTSFTFVSCDQRIPFELTSISFCIIDCQMCRMVEYYCSFDRHLKPLLAIILFWAKVNNVSFSEVDSNKMRPKSNVKGFEYVETASIVWLVIFFLCKSGILPTPREIQKRRHKPFLFNLGECRRDINFTIDLNFVEEWNISVSQSEWAHKAGDNPEEDIVSVLTLAKCFFQFYSSTFQKGSWVLNTRDAELHDKDVFLKAPGTKWGTKLADYELKSAQDAIKCNSSKLYPRIYIIHPFFEVARMLCPDDIFGQGMKKTAENLEQVLRNKTRDDLDLEKALRCHAE